MTIKDLRKLAFDYQFISIIDDEYQEWWFGYLHNLPARYDDSKIIKIGSQNVEQYPHENMIVVMI